MQYPPYNTNASNNTVLHGIGYFWIFFSRKKKRVYPSSYLHQRGESQFSKKGKGKLIVYERDIMCLPQSFLRDIISIPKKKNVRHFLAANKLVGKIQLRSNMDETEIFQEIRSVFHVPMRYSEDFNFKILQSSGGDSRSLIVPELSHSYKWTAGAVAGRNAKTPIYILAEDDLQVISFPALCKSATVYYVYAYILHSLQFLVIAIKIRKRRRRGTLVIMMMMMIYQLLI